MKRKRLKKVVAAVSLSAALLPAAAVPVAASELPVPTSDLPAALSEEVTASAESTDSRSLLQDALTSPAVRLLEHTEARPEDVTGPAEDVPETTANADDLTGFARKAAVAVIGTTAVAVPALAAGTAAILGTTALTTMGTLAAITTAGLTTVTVPAAGAVLGTAALTGAGLFGAMAVSVPLAAGALALPVAGAGAMLTTGVIGAGLALAAGTAATLGTAGTLALGTTALATLAGAAGLAGLTALGITAGGIALGISALITAALVGSALTGLAAMTGAGLIGTTLTALVAGAGELALLTGTALLGLGTTVLALRSLGLGVATLATVVTGIIGMVVTGLFAIPVALAITNLVLAAGVTVTALAATILGTLGAIALVAGSLVVSALATGVLLLGMGLISLLTGNLALALLIGCLALPLITGPLLFVLWGNLGRAWGAFLGPILADPIAFVLAGTIGLLLGGALGGLLGEGINTLLGQTQPWIPVLLGITGALGLGAIWELICIPLWTLLGAINGAVFCAPIGAMIGAVLGTFFPLLAPVNTTVALLFAAGWDALHMMMRGGIFTIARILEYVPRYAWRWGRALLSENVTGLHRLFHLLTLQYGPLFNHIHVYTSLGDSLQSGWGSPLYMLYGKTVVTGLPVLDSAPYLVGYALGAWVNQIHMPGARSNEFLYLVDPLMLFPDWVTRTQMQYLSGGSINTLRLMLVKIPTMLKIMTSDVVNVDVGANNLWLPFMAAVYDIEDDGRLPFDLLTMPQRTALFGRPIAILDDVFSYIRAWVFHPLKWPAYALKLLDGVLKWDFDFFIDFPLILLHIYLLNPRTKVVVSGLPNVVNNWDLVPGLDDNLIMYAMQPLYSFQNAYRMLFAFLYPGNWDLIPGNNAYFADMQGIQLVTEEPRITLEETISLDNSGYNPHPTALGRMQQANRILRALGQPSPYGWSEISYLSPNPLWNLIIPYRPIVPTLSARFRPFDSIFPRSLYNFQSLLPSFTPNLPVNY